MRSAVVLTLTLTGLVVLAAAEDTKPLTPAEAIRKVNEQVTVQMVVKAAKNRLEKRGEIYLDSEGDFRDKKNLGIVVTRAGAAKFEKAGVADPAEHFKGKTIRVRGKVILAEGRPRLEVDDPKQIQIVEKDKERPRSGSPASTRASEPPR
jgi:hypothetical protein